MPQVVCLVWPVCARLGRSLHHTEERRRLLYEELTKTFQNVAGIFDSHRLAPIPGELQHELLLDPLGLATAMPYFRQLIDKPEDLAEIPDRQALLAQHDSFKRIGAENEPNQKLLLAQIAVDRFQTALVEQRLNRSLVLDSANVLFRNALTRVIEGSWRRVFDKTPHPTGERISDWATPRIPKVDFLN